MTSLPTYLLTYLPTYLPPSVGDLVVHKPNSRLHEKEADTVGVLLCARAGYDPSAAVRVFENMAKVEEKRSGGVRRLPGFLSTASRAGGREGGRGGRRDERKRTGLGTDRLASNV